MRRDPLAPAVAPSDPLPALPPPGSAPEEFAGHLDGLVAEFRRETGALRAELPDLRRHIFETDQAASDSLEAVVTEMKKAIAEAAANGRLHVDHRFDPGRPGEDDRAFVNGVLRVLRSGARWRDLPGRYGAKWRTVHTRFCRWAHGGAWERVFRRLARAPDDEYRMIDGTIVGAHQGAPDQAPGAPEAD